MATATSSGRWVTLGRRGKNGEKRGGSRVFIENGRITKGSPSLTGRKIDALKDADDSKWPFGPGGRRAASEYDRAVARKKARSLGVNPKDLDALAGEILAHANAFKDDQRRFLQDARSLSKRLGYGSLQGLNLRTARGVDADSIKGLDDVAARMLATHPEFFAGHETDLPGRLFGLLTEGNPEPMSEAEAYAEALDHLAQHGERHIDAQEAETVNPRAFGRLIRKGWQETFRGIPHEVESLGRPGQGDYGSGLYLSTDRYTAQLYADGPEGTSDGVVARVAIDPKAKLISIEDIDRQHQRMVERGQASALIDMGEFAREQGYDGITVAHKGYINIVNPAVVRVSEAPERRGDDDDSVPFARADMAETFEASPWERLRVRLEVMSDELADEYEETFRAALEETGHDVERAMAVADEVVFGEVAAKEFASDISEHFSRAPDGLQPDDDEDDPDEDDPDDPFAWIAQRYADRWSILAAQGEEVPEAELEAAGAQLKGTGWRLVSYDGVWIVDGGNDPDEIDGPSQRPAPLPAPVTPAEVKDAIQERMASASDPREYAQILGKAFAKTKDWAQALTLADLLIAIRDRFATAADAHEYTRILHAAYQETGDWREAVQVADDVMQGAGTPVPLPKSFQELDPDLLNFPAEGMGTPVPLPQDGETDPFSTTNSVIQFARVHGDAAALVASPEELLQCAIEHFDPFADVEPDGPDVVVTGGAAPHELAHLRREIRAMRQGRIARGLRPDLPTDYVPARPPRRHTDLEEVNRDHQRASRYDREHQEAAQQYAAATPGRRWVEDNLVRDTDGLPRRVIIVEPGDEMPVPNRVWPQLALDRRNPDSVRTHCIPSVKQLADQEAARRPSDKTTAAPDMAAIVKLMAQAVAEVLQSQAAPQIVVDVPATTINVPAPVSADAGLTKRQQVERNADGQMVAVIERWMNADGEIVRALRTELQRDVDGNVATTTQTELDVQALEGAAHYSRKPPPGVPLLQGPHGGTYYVAPNGEHVYVNHTGHGGTGAGDAPPVPQAPKLPAAPKLPPAPHAPSAPHAPATTEGAERQQPDAGETHRAIAGVVSDVAERAANHEGEQLANVVTHLQKAGKPMSAAEVSQKLKELYDNTELTLNFRPTDRLPNGKTLAESLAAQGRLQNVFETGQSGVSSKLNMAQYQKDRADWEARISEQSRNLPASAKPKYAALNYGNGASALASVYGEGVFVLNKDAFKNRMTLSPDNTSRTEAHDVAPAIDPVNALARSGQALRAAGLVGNEDRVKGTRYNTYTECQLFGDVPLDKNTVKEIRLPKVKWWQLSRTGKLKPLIDFANNAGIPVNYY